MCSIGHTGADSVAQAGLTLTAFLPAQLLKCWNYRCGLTPRADKTELSGEVRVAVTISRGLTVLLRVQGHSEGVEAEPAHCLPLRVRFPCSV